jgi:hypothetical protein
VASSVALVAVRRAFACDAPQAAVDGESERAYGGDGGRDTGPAFFLAGVVGQVVDETVGYAVAELGVVGGVEDERVPALVYLWRPASGSW